MITSSKVERNGWTQADCIVSTGGGDTSGEEQISMSGCIPKIGWATSYNTSKMV
jgi:hypothetical protein